MGTQELPFIEQVRNTENCPRVNFLSPMLTSISCLLLPTPSGVHLGSPTAGHELFGHEAIFCSHFTVLSTAEP